MQKLSRPTFTLSVREIESCRGFWGNRLGTKSWVHQWKSYTVRKKKMKSQNKKKSLFYRALAAKKRAPCNLFDLSHASFAHWLSSKGARCNLPPPIRIDFSIHHTAIMNGHIMRREEECTRASFASMQYYRISSRKFIYYYLSTCGKTTFDSSASSLDIRYDLLYCKIANTCFTFHCIDA